jgi:hypothetical protein
MRYYGIDDRYVLAAENFATLPDWDTKYTRSFIFVEDVATMYYGTGTGWAPCSANVAAGYIHTQTVAASTWTVTHNLNQKNVSISVYGTDGKMMMPEDIELVNANSSTVTFTDNEAGTAVVVTGNPGVIGGGGTSGTSGTSGTNGEGGGTSGTSGTSGVNGADGTNGTSGSSGTSGSNGNNGTSGTSGTSGSNGANAALHLGAGTDLADHDYQGPDIQGVAGAAISRGQLCYVKLNGGAWKYYPYDADATDKLILPSCMATADVAQGATGTFLLPGGTMRDDTWALAGTADASTTVYASTTAGGLTMTAPATSGNEVVMAGVLIGANVLQLQIGYAWLEVK